MYSREHVTNIVDLESGEGGGQKGLRTKRNGLGRRETHTGEEISLVHRVTSLPEDGGSENGNDGNSTEDQRKKAEVSSKSRTKAKKESEERTRTNPTSSCITWSQMTSQVRLLRWYASADPQSMAA